MRVLVAHGGCLAQLGGIRGAKYGYSRAAGFNSVVYVQRRDKNLVAVIFGARSTATLIRKMGEIVDEGFVAMR